MVDSVVIPDISVVGEVSLEGEIRRCMLDVMRFSDSGSERVSAARVLLAMERVRGVSLGSPLECALVDAARELASVDNET